MKRSLTLLVFTISLTPSAAAFAGPILFFDVHRVNGCCSNGSGYGELGPWSAFYSDTNANGSAAAAQNTDISGSFIGGSASTTAEYLQGTDFWGAGSQLLVDFGIEGQPYIADLSVLLSAVGGGRASYSLTQFNGPLVVGEFVSNNTMLATYSATLMPGKYHFRLDSNAGVTPSITSGASSFNGGLTLTPVGGVLVPEPATLTLFGTGLAAVIARRRRRQQ